MSYQQDALKEFSRIPILSSLNDDEVFDFIRLCRVHRVAKGDPLFKQGEPGRSMYIIGEGGVDVFLEREGERELVAKFGALDVIGELALLDPGERSATAIANAETTIYEVSGEDFDGMVRQHHPAAFKILRGVSRLVCKRIRSVNERIEAELTGAPRPAPHTGEYERARTAAQSRVGGPDASRPGDRPAMPTQGGRSPEASRLGTAPPTGSVEAAADKPTGMFRRVLARFWGGDEE